MEQRERVQLKKKRERQRRQKMKRIACFIIAVILLVVLILGVRACVTKDSNTESLSTEVASTEVLYEEVETETETEVSVEELLGGYDANGNLTSMHIENTQLDITAYDTTILEWGQGKNFDSYNRPGGCLMYQEKYGDLNALFLGDWEEGDDKVIYLTFDIGYTNEYTIQILDTLAEKNVKAVFFATLPAVNDDTEVIQRIIDEGHELGNHSVTHPSTGVARESVEDQYAEIMDVHNAVLEKYGYEMHLFRYPAGIFSEQSLAIVNNCNYKSVFWSYAHHDWDTENQPDVATSLANAVERLHPGAIYLLHGISSTNAAMLGDFIDQAIAQGYTFELIQ